ncbi:beta-beta-alpha zinc fingers domain-containing protein [Dioscorea alata]|uniref:Beta-beta-alpha zinc fingers domain-containing protein n=1 Tax=Dioscorea alata TaxID=55571 RepID=A0ACB7WNV7_DIOAL|nr:beta-beta-alpha zinc fingers domain-containing protein [Dioscorea alata]
MKSIVWEHFTRQEINGEWKAICNYCKRMLGGKSKNGATHLHDHVKRCPKPAHKDLKQQLLLVKKTKEDGTKLANYAFNQALVRKEIAQMIIVHEYPISIVDHVRFRKYSSLL